MSYWTRHGKTIRAVGMTAFLVTLGAALGYVAHPPQRECPKAEIAAPPTIVPLPRTDTKPTLVMNCPEFPKIPACPACPACPSLQIDGVKQRRE